jgi:outer membrane cobalamin receptor
VPDYLLRDGVCRNTVDGDRAVRGATLILLVSLSVLEAKAQVPQPVPSAKETVVVLGSVEPVSQGDSSRTVVAIDTQQHALAFRDIEDYLRTDASVEIQQRAAAGVMADISIRGASFEQTLVLLAACVWMIWRPHTSIWIFPRPSSPLEV